MLQSPTRQTDEVRYEKSDANVGVILAFALGLVTVIAFVLLTAAWLFAAFKESVGGADAPLSTLAAQERLRLPHDLGKMPSPVLQENELVDLGRLRKKEDAQLNGYGWIEPKAGIVHIPIAEAMRLLADPKTAKAHGIRVENAPKKGAG